MPPALTSAVRLPEHTRRDIGGSARLRFSTCEDSGGTRMIQYFVVPRKRGGFALFSVASAMSAERSPASLGEDRLNNYRKAALTAVND